MSQQLTPTLLLLLDGWGQAPAGPGNAFSQAKTPNIDSLLATCPKALLQCSGRSVGLPDGYMGNSEVGHMNIGAGRIVYQDMTRIDIAIEEGAFAVNPVIASTLESVRASGGTLHLLGLLSDGGVHSHIRHVFALLDAAAAVGVPVAIHCFTDGRDTDPASGISFVKELSSKLGPSAVIVSIIGRYYAMDRDNRWERTQKAWDALVHGKGRFAPDAVEAVQTAYDSGETDEFITPCLIVKPGEKPVEIRDGDGVFFFNFRADRARQMLRCFYDKDFAEFDRGRVPDLVALASMTLYDSAYPAPAAFVRQELHDSLGEVVSRLGLLQARIAETEKYAHVTYFFNCGREEPFPGEERRLIPSPRDVATYDLKPEMSVHQVAETLITEWNTGKYALIVCNFANLDMVGHTGVIPAAITACEAVDACVGQVLEAVRATGGRMLLTADHGNAEEMLTPADHPMTAHSMNPVALVLVDSDPVKQLKPEGKLGDIAPTILRLWDQPVPEAMTGQSLYNEDASR